MDGDLPKQSVIKLTKLFTLHSDLIVKKLLQLKAGEEAGDARRNSRLPLLESKGRSAINKARRCAAGPEEGQDEEKETDYSDGTAKFPINELRLSGLRQVVPRPWPWKVLASE